MSGRLIAVIFVCFILGAYPGVAYSIDKGKSYVSMVPPVIITDDQLEEISEESGTGSDPIEPFNRAIYKFNDTVDNVFLKPVARGYRAVVPQYGRDRIGDVLQNLSSPVSFANSVLQGDVEGSFTVFWRFVINSTIGIGGFNDIASEFGLKKNDKDFGQTMGVYGAEPGAYVMLPFLGPTTVRDGLGRVADYFSNPFSYADVWPTVAYRGTDLVQTREQLLDFTDDIEENAFDPYASVRSSYLQHREKKIREAIEAREKGKVKPE